MDRRVERLGTAHTALVWADLEAHITSLTGQVDRIGGVLAEAIRSGAA